MQAKRPGAIVFAVVRNARTSTHLTAAIDGLKNVHVVEADVVDHHSLEVRYIAIFNVLVDATTSPLT